MEKYALGHYSLKGLKAQPLSYISFLVASFFPIILLWIFRHSDKSGLVYTPRQHVLFSYKLNKFSSHPPPKYHNLKEVYAFEFSKQVQFRTQNGTLPIAKFLSVNQQKNNPDYYNNKVFKRLPGTKYTKKKTQQKRYVLKVNIKVSSYILFLL